MSIRDELTEKLRALDEQIEKLSAEAYEIRGMLRAVTRPRSARGATRLLRDASRGGATINPCAVVGRAGLRTGSACSIASVIGLVRVGPAQWRYPDGHPEAVKP